MTDKQTERFYKDMKDPDKQLAYMKFVEKAGKKMAAREASDVCDCLDTAKKLVAQSEGILARSGFGSQWTDELVCIQGDLVHYMHQFRTVWMED